MKVELPPFSRVTIVGVGLIGGSLALALRKRFPSIRIIGVDRKRVLRRAIERKAIHEGSQSLKQSLADAELVVLATPVDHIVNILPTVAKYTSPSAVVTDTGSVKKHILDCARVYFPNGNFVGGHPMAGAEFAGINAAHPLLFQNALYLLTPLRKNSAFRKLVALISALDARVLTIDAETHDKVVAAVSHLPQLAAVALVNTVGYKHAQARTHLTLAAGGFRDMTRIASSPYDIWRDILAFNTENIAEAVKLYIESLTTMITMLQRAPSALKKEFVRSRVLRSRIPRSMKGFISALVDISVYIEDKPGQLARLTALLGKAHINIKDIELVKVREGRGGTFRLYFDSVTTADEAKIVLQQAGFEICE
ncbi:MAG: prephenate dehydrogenase/arogenate dehydrogenase family protein [Bacteroidetes bacterium]|nr:prephenate dehydrogenase/arogenate dehydrogenase family protein [Bacteroidota bacterium]